MRNKIWLSALMLVCLSVSVLSLAGAPAAKAASCAGYSGRACFYGYFLNTYDEYGSDVFAGGVSANSADELINFITPHLGDSDSLSETRASKFLVLTMMGYGPGTSESLVDNVNDPVVQDWERRIRGMDAAGLIDWNYPFPFTCGSLNTFRQTNNDIGFFENSKTNARAGGPVCGPSTTVPTIGFKNPAGAVVYAIKRVCGNPVGDLSEIPADFNMVANIIPGTSTPNAPGPLEVGTSYSIRPEMTNTGGVKSTPVTMTVALPSNVTYVSSNNGASYNGSTRKITWPAIKVNNGQLISGNSFVINPTAAAAGHSLTFTEVVSPKNSAGGSSSDTITYNVISGVWTLSGTTTVSPAVAKPGDFVMFTHTITNDSDTAASGSGWSWNMFMVPPTPGLTTEERIIIGGNTNPSYSGYDLAPGDSKALGYGYRIPLAAQAGQQYCQDIGWDPVNSKRTVRNGRSVKACVTVVTTAQPVISVTKVATPTTLPSSGGTVVYDYKAVNIGTTALANVTESDDKCSPVTRLSGDTNGNNILDVGETWAFRCTTILTQTTTNVFTLTGTANGQSYTFTASATVVVQGPPSPSPTPSYPIIVGSGSDVHAGGGLADANGNCSVSGAITSNFSYGEYVVSSKNAVSGFGSNNSNSSKAATLGSNGDYSFVCRPDLVTKAAKYISANVPGLGYKTVPDSFSMSDPIFNSDGVYYHAGDVTITGGSYTHKITLYVTGTVNITGSISLDPALSTSGKDQKSFGLIAKNGINIAGAATQVDSYLFSDGTIDTCVEASFASCSNTLTVNGFLMANTLNFHRLGPPNAGIVVGEQGNMTGQLYVNPPALFGSLLDASLMIQQGERPVLY